jgi:hypothetical protein
MADSIQPVEHTYTLVPDSPGEGSIYQDEQGIFRYIITASLERKEEN